MDEGEQSQYITNGWKHEKHNANKNQHQVTCTIQKIAKQSKSEESEEKYI